MAKSHYPYEEDIPISRLRVDLKNPRLPEVQDSQLSAFHIMARVQEEKLVALVKHIVTNGLNPAEKFIVIPDDEDQFITLDGNRRLTALRSLESPEIIASQVSDNALKQIKQLTVSYEENPIKDVPCIVFQDRDHADTWIELIHDGESGGAGLVKWSSQQRSRYQSRKGKKAFHLQVLDYVEEHGTLNEKTRERIKLGKYPTSTLKRALGTPYVREKLGLEMKDGSAYTKYPKEELLKGLSKIIDDIGIGKINVNDLRSQTDRIKYIDGFTTGDLPAPEAKGKDISSIEDAPEKVVEDGFKATTKQKERRHSSTRNKLIPSHITFNISVSRLNDIYIELKRRLLVNDTPNAVAVLLRSFFEMSIDEYIDRNNITLKGNDTLSKKVDVVANYMGSNNILSKKNLHPIRRAASDRDAPHSTTTLNGYVHNRHFTPGSNELKAIWDTLQIFFEKIWK